MDPRLGEFYRQLDVMANASGFDRYDLLKALTFYIQKLDESFTKEFIDKINEQRRETPMVKVAPVAEPESAPEPVRREIHMNRRFGGVPEPDLDNVVDDIDSPAEPDEEEESQKYQAPAPKEAPKPTPPPASSQQYRMSGLRRPPTAKIFHGD